MMLVISSQEQKTTNLSNVAIGAIPRCCAASNFTVNPSLSDQVSAVAGGDAYTYTIIRT